MIQIRNVPEPIHRTLKARAALSGLSLSDYLMREIRLVAEAPTAAELADRVQQRAAAFAGVKESPAQAVRAERRAR